MPYTDFCSQDALTNKSFSDILTAVSCAVTHQRSHPRLDPYFIDASWKAPCAVQC